MTRPLSQYTLQQKVFLLVLTLATIGFGWIMLPYFGAVFWGVVLAILFMPLYCRLLKATNNKRTAASLLTLLIIVVMVILPVSLITASLVQQAVGVYNMVGSGHIDFGMYFRQILGALPQWMVSLLDRYDLTSLATLQQKLSGMAAQSSQVAARRALDVGRNTMDFLVSMTIMLYLLFFLLRDGEGLFRAIKDAVPLGAEQQRVIFGKFATVVRATVKGTIVVAILQGALGGLMFWFLGIRAALLWAALMALLSLLPAVGAALVWFPVALYLLATGAVWQGLVLIAFGVLVIGLVDNLLRPMLVGTDIKMPDYVVLLSTLGGIEIFGMNGIVLGPLIAAMFMVVWDILSASRRAQDPKASS
jgi:predicted PurR-regulated permease PerM